MPRYDLEELCSDIAGILQSQLNAKLAAIDSDKNDGISLAQLSSDAYFFQELNNNTINYDPFLLYGVEAIQTVSQEGAAGQEATISVIVVLSDPGSDSDVPKRMFRYSRALKEIFEENYSLFRISVKLKIQNLMPVQFNLLNSSKIYRAVGINLIASFC